MSTVFDYDVLDRVLHEDQHDPDSEHDFGKNILPKMVADKMNIFAYPYGGYWIDVGTVDAYWEAHMDLLSSPPSLNLNDRTWVIHTRSEERPPVRIGADANIVDSMITDGSVIGAGAGHRALHPFARRLHWSGRGYSRVGRPE